MENRLDELFKTKLEHHAAPPSGNAWQRIEGSLAKKNNAFGGWRIAAGVLITVGLISALYWSQRSTVETHSQPSLSKTDSPQQPVEKVEPAIKEISQSEPAIASAQQVPSKTNHSHSLKKENIEVSKVSKTETPIAVSSPESAKPIEEVTLPNELPTVAQVEQVAQVTKVEKPIVLEFTLAPITTEVTAQTEEKSNGFKKLFSKARDLKNGESGLDLSDLTNKLFASNQKQTKDNIN
ncbi:MAG: hypothetical protein HOP30_03125 [Cyclobacteriaceae bacterium]|nr:hypothetical protein [Cyclobacteriaceae bacterium]